MQKNGRQPEARDDEACYHPLKAVLGVALAFGVPLVLAAYLAVVAKPYTYALQDLPDWLTGSYGSRGDVMGPLGAYTQGAAPIGATGWVRVFVRLFEMG